MSAVLRLSTPSMTVRDQVSLAVSALALVMVWLVGQIRFETDKPIEPATISVSMEAPAPAPQTQPTAEPQKPEPKQLTRSVTQEAATSRTAPAEDSLGPTAPSAPPRSSPTAAPPVVASPETKRVDLENEFENKIRALIEAGKRYPTGREASLQKPQGVVGACVVVQRDGVVQDIKIQKSSTYPLLDTAAKRLLANLAYPALPAEIFPGHASHTYCVNLDYKVPA